MGKKETDEYIVTNFRSRKEIIADLNKYAQKKSMNRTSVINMLVVDFIKKEKEEEEEERRRERERE